MAKKATSAAMSHRSPAGSTKSYVIGFGLSILLTMLAFIPVYRHVHSNHQSFSSQESLVAFIIALAVIQLFVQLFFFLHLGKESRPRWNLILLLFALMVVVIVVVGSLWIMNNLNYHMHSPEQVDKEIIQDEGVHNH